MDNNTTNVQAKTFDEEVLDALTADLKPKKRISYKSELEKMTRQRNGWMVLAIISFLKVVILITVMWIKS